MPVPAPSSDVDLEISCGDSARRVLLVSSAGGHLSQLMELRPWWIHHIRKWVTFDLPDARSKLQGEDVEAAYHPTTRNVPNLLRNIGLARNVLATFKPDVVISTGAAVAFPFFVLARARKIPTVYLEVYDRIDSRTLTGRLCGPFTTKFLTQWPEQHDLYQGSLLVGPVY